jgi:hypothetical protein
MPHPENLFDLDPATSVYVETGPDGRAWIEINPRLL